MSNSAQTWRNMGLGARLSLSNFALVSAVFVIFVGAISYKLSETVENRATAEVVDKTKMVTSLVDASDQDLRKRTAFLAKAFQARLAGKVELTSDVVDIAGHPAPTLKINDKAINLNFDVVDQFTQSTGAVATVFAKTDEDYIRITTSLKNDKDARAIGTLLDHAHPGYQAAMAGNSFTGLAVLFGKQYMTQYDPILDSAGKVVGLSFIGVDFTDYLANLKALIKNMKIGESGYFYVLDAKPGASSGNLIVHPSMEGKNILQAKDPSGREFIKEILDKKDGVIRYPWINKELGETAPREKVVAFSYIKNWNWVIAGGTYVDEYTKEIRILRNELMVFGVLMVLLIGTVLYFSVHKLVVKPIKQVQEAANRLAHGDLTVSVDLTRNDEIGHLVDSINEIGVGLAKVVQSVLRGSESVAAASAQIAQGNHDLSSRTESQASALEQTSASMQELTSTVKQNADSAKQASQLAQSASTVAVKGGKVVSQFVDTMKGINDSSQKISDIISVIDGIAFQTNILALNAAVEAARAGEQGRGFAVVATEVRSLAGRSANAAKEIKVLIGDSVDRVKKGSILVDEAGATMNDVVQGIGRVTDIMAEISAASEEQRLGVSQVLEAVTNMDQDTQQNASMVEEMAAAASSLKSQSEELVQTVSSFKLKIKNK